MDVLTDEQYEILAFIAICNRRSYLPTEEEVTLWRDSPHPRPAKYRRVPSGYPAPPGLTAALRQLGTIDVNALFQPTLASITAAMSGSNINWANVAASMSGGVKELEAPAETTIDHLVRLTWLRRVEEARGDRIGLQLTDLGRALYTDVEMNDATEEDFTVVVLGKEDPLAYPLLIGKLAGVGAGLLIDPYLKLEGLHHLVVSTQLTRLLVSDKGKQQAAEVGSMRTYLDTLLLPRDIEVRVSKDLHDRVVVADGGDVYVLGASLNGVGRKTTVFSPMPEAAADALAEECEELWEAADLVGPTPPEEEDEDEADGDDAEEAAE